MSQRKVIKVEKEELEKWRELFSLYGQKAALFEAKKISRKTINSILKEGNGVESVIIKVREYHTSQLQRAHA